MAGEVRGEGRSGENSGGAVREHERGEGEGAEGAEGGGGQPGGGREDGGAAAVLCGTGRRFSLFFSSSPPRSSPPFLPSVLPVLGGNCWCPLLCLVPISGEDAHSGAARSRWGGATAAAVGAC